MTRNRAVLLCAALLCAPRAVALGQDASPYLYLHHPLYAEIDLLVERGVLRGLSPVVRPYRRGDIARAVQAADTSRAGGVERGWLARLRRELRPELEGRVAVDGVLSATGRTHAHRDLLRPASPGRVDAAGEIDLRVVFPGVALETHLRADNYYWHDPQLPERVTSNRFRERAEDAYVELGGRHARVLVGRLYRNWAPARVQGTLLSDYAYSFDQAALWAGGEKLSLSLVAARLDDFPGDVRRYLALHRLDWQPSADLAVYGAEGVLYAGPGRDFELEFLNPVSLWFNENENERVYRGVASNNAFIGTGFWWRVKPSLIVFGDFTLDDIQVDAVNEPPSYAFYAGVVLPRLSERIVARASYTQVSNLSYRTATDFERYTFRGLGLARDFSDYDLLGVEVDWFAAPGLSLVPKLAVLRRGQGDLRQPWPASFDGVETVLSGNVVTTVRPSLGGRAAVGQVLRVEWYGGINFGRYVSRFVGRLQGRLRLTPS